MEIVDKRNNNSVSFKNIRIGDVFESNSEMFTRLYDTIDKNGKTFNALNLSTYDFTFF